MPSISSIINRHKAFWTHKRKILLLKVLGLFVLALAVQQASSVYVGHINGVPVGDLILSNIPAINLDEIVVQGALIATIIIIGVLLWKPHYILFSLAAVSIFIIVRAFFVSLTHIGVDPHEILLDPHDIGFGLYNILFNSKGDLFFSGHTGMPFLFGLVFLHERFWSRIFFAISLLFGISVLLGHVHYSIDVFAAPFITYTIFVITQKLFPEEYSFINGKL